MAVDVEASRRFAPGKKERAKPAKAKSGLGKTKGDAPSGKEKAAPSTRDAKASRSSSADPRRAPQKPARGGGKPPRAPRDPKKGAEDASARRASTPPLGVSPNELVAGLAGSLAMCVVSGVSKLVRRKLRGRASAEKKDPEKKDLSAEERAKLDAVKAELREALAQLREQRNSLDHLRKQNKEMARENQLLKVAAANAAAAKRPGSSSVPSRGGSPSGPLSLRASPASSAPASPEVETERGVEGVSGSGSGATQQIQSVNTYASGAVLARLLDPLPADADDATRASREVATRVLRSVLSLKSESSSSSSRLVDAESLVAYDETMTPIDAKKTTSIGEHMFEEVEEDAWAGVPRGSPGAGSEYDDARSAKSAASGFSGISDLSTVSAAEALLSRMRTKHVLMARIKNHR